MVRVSYNKLWKMLIDKEMQKRDLQEAAGNRLNHACRREYSKENAGMDRRGAGKAASTV